MNASGIFGTPWPFIIKICGVTREVDIRDACEAGANAVGINLWPNSSRYVPVGRAEELLRSIGDEMLRVGVVVADSTLDEVVLRKLCFDVIQIHGVESREDLPELGRPLWVAVAPDRVDRFPRYPLVIDTSWGSGRRTDWEALRQIQRDFVLSGGLNGDCVAQAVLSLRPAGVDVCSGVERAPGVKDSGKIRHFVRAAREAWAKLQRGALPVEDDLPC